MTLLKAILIRRQRVYVKGLGIFMSKYFKRLHSFHATFIKAFETLYKLYNFYVFCYINYMFCINHAIVFSFINYMNKFQRFNKKYFVIFKCLIKFFYKCFLSF